MARTTISNTEFMAWAKTRRREDDLAEEVAPLQSVQGGPSTTPSPTANAPTGASGVVTRPRFVVIPPSLPFQPLQQIRGRRRRRTIPLRAVRPKEVRRSRLRGHWPPPSLVARFGLTRKYPSTWVLASKTC